MSTLNRRSRSGLEWVSRDPSTASRLGDLGYVDAQGTWRVVLNIFNQKTCDRYGIKPLVLGTDITGMVTDDIHVADHPVVELRRGGSHRTVTMAELKEYFLSSEPPNL